jgi:uncharacterized protein YegP (UPF0339 family)
MEHVQYKRTKHGKWYFVVIAENGKQLVSSQKTYESKRNAKIGFDALHELLRSYGDLSEYKEPKDQKFKNTAPYGSDTR